MKICDFTDWDTFKSIMKVVNPFRVCFEELERKTFDSENIMIGRETCVYYGITHIIMSIDDVLKKELTWWFEECNFMHYGNNPPKNLSDLTNVVDASFLLEIINDLKIECSDPIIKRLEDVELNDSF